jgi:glyoxylase-like metal-dependent hydrolase (beta-lactamase superfamily II)
MRGRRIDDGDLSARSGISALEVQRLREGEFNEVAIRKIAPLLGLGGDALVALARKTWRPPPIEIEGLTQFNTPFDDMTVNSYLLWDPRSREAAAFDTGTDCIGILELLAAKNLSLKSIFLTHTHGDHIFDLDRLKSKTAAPAFTGEREPLEGATAFTPGRTFDIGSLRIETRLTSGHSPGGITYVIRGLSRPIAVVGDSIFAGSMGGGAVSYEDALRNNREQILTLSDDTTLCPGHGPLTTVGQEKINNPFFAADARPS